MSDGNAVEEALDGYPLDADYIGVEKERADVSTTDEQEEPEVDRSEGSAERYHTFDRSVEWEDRVERDAPVEHDGRAETRTGFDPREADDSHRWQRLNRLHDGKGSGKTGINRANRKRKARTLSSKLELTPHQVERSLYVIEDVGRLDRGFAHYSLETILLSVISLVANEDGRWIRDEAMFKRLCRETDTSLADVRNCRQIVRDKTDAM